MDIFLSRLSLIFFFVFFMFLGNVVGQQDTAYVELETTDYTLGVSARTRLYNVDFISFERDFWSVQKRDLSFGIRARYKWLNLAILYAFQDFYEGQSFTPDLVNVDIKLYPKSFFIKSNIQYTSFLRSIPNALMNISEASNDSKLFSLNLWGAYIFDSDKLSLSSAYSFVDRQKKTAGSWLVSSFIEEHRLNIALEDYESLGFEDVDQLKSLYKTRIGIGGGYTQSVVWNNFAWNSILSGGIEVASIRYHSYLEAQDREFTIMPNVRFNSSIVYYLSQHYFAVIGEYYPDIFNSPTRLDLEKNHAWMRLCYGYKF